MGRGTEISMLDPSVSDAKICTPDTKVTSGHFSPVMSGCQAARVEHYSASLELVLVEEQK